MKTKGKIYKETGTPCMAGSIIMPNYGLLNLSPLRIDWILFLPLKFIVKFLDNKTACIMTS